MYCQYCSVVHENSPNPFTASCPHIVASLLILEELVRGLDELGVHNGQTGERVDLGHGLAAVDAHTQQMGPDLDRVELGHESDAGSGAEWGLQRVNEAVHGGEGEGVEHAVPRRPVPGLHHPLDLAAQRAVAQLYALRPPGHPRRVDNEGGTMPKQLGIHERLRQWRGLIRLLLGFHPPGLVQHDQLLAVLAADGLQTVHLLPGGDQHLAF